MDERKKETLASWGKGCNGEWKLSEKKRKEERFIDQIVAEIVGKDKKVVAPSSRLMFFKEISNKKRRDFGVGP